MEVTADDPKMTTILVDDQEVQIKSQPFTVLVHQQDMNIEAPDHEKISPEETLQCAKDLEQDQWEQIMVHPKFLEAWDTLWKGPPPPQVLAKAPLGSRHVVGMILLLFKAFGEGRHIHLQYPETYLHPQQCARFMCMMDVIRGKPYKP